MAFLEVRDLSVRYPGQSEPVISGVSFSVEIGENILLLGPSGSGKSTLILALNGIIPQSVEAEIEGEVLLNGQNVLDKGVRETSREIGILFQDPDTQFCMLTVEDEVAFGLENLRLGREEMAKRIESGLAAVGLLPYLERNISELSGGLKQKLGLACLLAMDQPLLILDEPTANLDPKGAREVLDALDALARSRNKTLLFVEHQLDRIVPLIDRVLVLNRKGSLVYDGPPRPLFADRSEELVKEGIWVPRIPLAARQWAEKGWRWPVFPLTLEEWENGQPPSAHSPSERAITSSEHTMRSVDDAMEANYENGAPDPILEVREVAFAYGNQSVLKEVSFNVYPGEIVALLGVNGAGKSTLAQILMKLLVPTKGTVMFAGKPLEAWSARQLYRSAGFVFQNPEHQFVADTVEKELSYGFEKSGMARDKWWPRVQEQMERFGLTPYRHHNPYQLSQGQKRRLSVATMMVHDQQLLILDEPTFGQDLSNTESIMHMLSRLSGEGKAILLITHDLELVYAYAKRALVLDDGKIVFDGAPATLFADDEKLDRLGMEKPLTCVLAERVKAMKGGRTDCAGIVATP